MKKILIIDDEKDIRKALSTALKLDDEGYEIVCAGDGQSGLETVRKFRPDLILLDIMLPDLSGIEVCRSLKADEEYKSIHIIMLTALGQSENIVKGLSSGADDYVSKPFNMPELLARVRSHLKMRKLYVKVKTSERTYGTLLQSLPDVVYKLDMKGNFVFISVSVKSMGFKPEELLGRHFSVMVHPDDLPLVSLNLVLPKYTGKTTGDNRAPKLFDERRSIERATKNLEFRLVPKERSNGKVGSDSLNVAITIAYGEVVSAGQYDSEGKEIIGTVGMIRDISERKQAEEIRWKLETRIHQMQKLESLGVLADGIAHDFNNILTGIVGFAELTIGNVSENSEIHHNMNQILRSGYRARDLVKQILNFSSLDKDREFKSIQLHSIIKESLKLLRATMPATIEISHKIDENAGNAIADSTSIHQVIMNLCVNAEQAMRDKGGVLEVILEPVKVDSDLAALHYNLGKGYYLKLTISDTGHGMDKKTLRKIFDPFFTTKGVVEGAGLGLAVVHGIVMGHGGEIIVDSEPGKGTTVQVYLPKVENAEEYPLAYLK